MDSDLASYMITCRHKYIIYMYCGIDTLANDYNTII